MQKVSELSKKSILIPQGALQQFAKSAAAPAGRKTASYIGRGSLDGAGGKKTQVVSSADKARYLKKYSEIPMQNDHFKKKMKQIVKG